MTTSIKVLDALTFGMPESWKLDTIHRDGEEAHAIVIIEGRAFLIEVEELKEEEEAS